MASQRRRLWVNIETAFVEPGFGGYVGLHPLYEVHRRQVLNEYWSVLAMVVEGRHVEDIFELVSLVLFLIISWTFRILAHEEDH